MQAYDTFKVEEDKGHITIGSKWMITLKERQNGQKMEFMAKLVIHRFRDRLKPQSNSPTASKVSFNLLMVLAVKEVVKLSSIDF